MTRYHNDYSCHFLRWPSFCVTCYKINVSFNIPCWHEGLQCSLVLSTSRSQIFTGGCPMVVRSGTSGYEQNSRKWLDVIMINPVISSGDLHSASLATRLTSPLTSRADTKRSQIFTGGCPMVERSGTSCNKQNSKKWLDVIMINPVISSGDLHSASLATRLTSPLTFPADTKRSQIFTGGCPMVERSGTSCNKQNSKKWLDVIMINPVISSDDLHSASLATRLTSPLTFPADTKGLSALVLSASRS